MKNLFKFHYDREDDVLTIYDFNRPPFETIEFSEYLNFSVDKEGNLVGLEIFDASDFFCTLNPDINKDFLSKLESVELEYKIFRNTWFLIVWLKSGVKIYSQQLPPIRKSDYISPLIASCQ